MKRTRRILFTMLTSGALLLPLAGLLGGGSAEGSPAGGGNSTSGASERAPMTVVPRGNFTVEQAQAFQEFDVYSVGPEFEGHNLEAVVREEAPPAPEGRLAPPVRLNIVQFLYGSCEIAPGPDGSYDGGCAPPLAVQVWPACERYQDLYPFEPDETIRIRGAAAAFYEAHRRLEIYTGASTVVVFGRDRETLVRAARQLRGINVAINATDPLPPEEPGARRGKIACSE